MIQNPILPGFNPDPCICRKGDDYYLAVSTFEWFPGIPVYHSRDLKNWELYTHVLTDDEKVDLKKLPSAKGIWAPCLTYCEEEDMFYVVYGVMNSMNARYFDVDNFMICAKDIRGPWSEPVYLHSSGFDASMFHDTNGKKYIVSLEWETREGYEKPGAICMVEYDPAKKEIVGYPKRIWRGGTDRGCIEAPHLTKRGEYYYIMCAEGGTGYNHCVTMGRSGNVWGPYEKDPYNPDSILQKSGHGSYVELPTGEVYLVHLCSRPFVPELRCTLGRETAIQKMMWTEDNWLRMADGSNLAKMEVPESSLPEYPVEKTPDFDDFDGEELGNFYYAPRIMPERFADVKARKGYVRLRGQESRTSLNKVSILARKLTSVYARITTKMEFVHKHCHLENGEKTEFLNTRIPVEDKPIYLRLYIEGRKSWFEWSYDGENYQKIGRIFDTTRFSDEYCKYGEFTGTMVGITCADRVLHKKCADFDFFEYKADEIILKEIWTENGYD